MMATLPLFNVIDPPPRLTGDAAQDTVAVIQWLNAFYVKGVLSGGLLQPQNMAAALISLGALPGAADMLAYYTAEDTFDLTGFTAFARTLLDDADADEARATLGAGTVTAVTGTEPIVSSGGDAPAISISDFVGSGATHARGAVPDPGAVAGTTKFLREDATFAIPPGAGDVVGPAMATGNNVVLFDGTTGKIIKDGGTLGTAAYEASGAFDPAGSAASVTPTTLGLVIGTHVQAYDADLTTWAGITPGANVATALAVAVDTDGAFVVKGGELGTPSSGLLTNLTLGSDVDGDIMYRASGVLNRLAKGAANTKLFMNAGATAPEWATQFKAVNTTWDSSLTTRTQAYTGVGFKPSMMLMLTSTSGFHGSYSEGWYDGSTYACKYTNEVPNTQMYTSGIGVVGTALGNTIITVSSFDSDGVTLKYARSGTVTGTLSVVMLFFR